MNDRLTLRRPDDWHVHLRDGDMLRAVAPHTARVMGRAIVMPNLVPPVTTAAHARAYRDRIAAAVPAAHGFTPLMTAYLTDHTDADDLIDGYRAGVFAAAKLYPAGATTNSHAGVTNLDAMRPVFERMADAGMPLLVHGEVTAAHVDIFDREAVFLDTVLEPLLHALPGLRVVVEHATTAHAVQLVRSFSDRVGATITPQHLLANRNDLLVGGVRPHLYCLPVLKRATHQQALIDAATSGEPMFFLGTDSAPHAVHRKETACGCAGCFTAPIALELYAEAFDRAGALDRLEGFASLHGPAFYGLPPHDDTVTLVRSPWRAPARVDVAGDAGAVALFYADHELSWRMAGC